eukprot:1161294-Pelagomonas_calceolata.AAC.2
MTVSRGRDAKGAEAEATAMTHSWGARWFIWRQGMHTRQEGHAAPPQKRQEPVPQQSRLTHKHANCPYAFRRKRHDNAWHAIWMEGCRPAYYTNKCTEGLAF